MDIKIVDNFIDEQNFHHIRTMLLSDYFPWFLSQVLEDELADTHKYNFQFCHIFHGQDHNESIFFSELHPILEKLNILDIHHIKTNLLTRTDNIIKHGFHVDILDAKPNHRTSIFYINNCDGFTEFEDGTIVNSKENRLVTFPSTLKHTGTSCTNNHLRLVINFNYTIKD